MEVVSIDEAQFKTPDIEPIVKQIFTAEEAEDIFNFLKEKNFEYHKPYVRYNKVVKVPRGQASYTLHENIHYNYGKIAGSSPPNEIMCDRLKEITRRTNEALGRNYNTILMNVYKDGKDAIGGHKDNENGWAEKSGFATLAFGCERPFMIEKCDTLTRQRILHKNGMVIEMPYPMNHHYFHSVPSCSAKIATRWRISLTFREIVPIIPT
jgi:alkylated DNA repair dioxygenase AlkB